MGETIVLPKSGVVLTQFTTCRWRWSHESGAAFEFLEDEAGRCSASIADNDEVWTVGTRAECIAWLDARVLETRAALTPPGHVLVGPDARETVARELWEFNRVCEWTEATEDEKTDYLLGADAVLAAIGVRGGA